VIKFCEKCRFERKAQSLKTMLEARFGSTQDQKSQLSISFDKSGYTGQFEILALTLPKKEHDGKESKDSKDNKNDTNEKPVYEIIYTKEEDGFVDTEEKVNKLVSAISSKLEEQKK